MKFILLAILMIACKPNSQEAGGETITRESVAEQAGDVNTEKLVSNTEGAEGQEADYQSSMAVTESEASQVESVEGQGGIAIRDLTLDTVEKERTPISKYPVGGFTDTNNIEAEADGSIVDQTPLETEEEAIEQLEVPLVNQVSDLHLAFDAILKEYVDAAGNVDYKGLKSNQQKLDSYLKALAENPVQSSWSKDAQLAYWINAYNAYTLKLIIDNYPLKSIMDLEGGKVWDKKWIELGNKVYSLNEIEHDIIRPEFNEPRIHFAVNCAAASCPPLAAKAFTVDNLESLLEDRTNSFINNRGYNQISASGARISKIFDWYGSDFGDLISYLNKYNTTSMKKNANVTFLEYDWSLNSQ